MFDCNKVEELYPGAGVLMLEPQLIHKGTDSQLKACDDGTWFAELKKDGALYMYVKGFGGENYLFGRTVSKKTGLLTEKSANVPHIIEAFKNIPNGTILLGEIYYPGKTSKDVTSIMGCLPKKAIERQEGEYGYIHYYVYDCLEYNGISLLKYDNWIRYQITKRIFEKIIPILKWEENENTIKFYSKYIELAEAITEEIYHNIGKALSEGEEGLVVKKKTGLYEPGKRPMTMLKAKQVDHIDAVIIGFKDPVKEYTGKEIETWQYWEERLEQDKEGCFKYSKTLGLYYNDYVQNPHIYQPITKHYYYGWKNAIEIGAYDNEGNIHSIGTIASGLTDYMREDMSLHPENYLGKVVEIQCMMKDNKEKTLRHGFYLKTRYDKPATDCLLEDIFS